MRGQRGKLPLYVPLSLLVWASTCQLSEWWFISHFPSPWNCTIRRLAELEGTIGRHCVWYCILRGMSCAWLQWQSETS
ncbi:unnamed protein product, partial [Symbiodinium microadriaticum]